MKGMYPQYVWRTLCTMLFLVCSIPIIHAQDEPIIVNAQFPVAGKFTDHNADGSLFSKWESTTSPKITVTSKYGGIQRNNMTDNQDGTVGIAAGADGKSYYIFELPEGYLFGNMTIKGTQHGLTGDQTMTLTIGGVTAVFNATNRTSISYTFKNINARTFELIMSGDNKLNGTINLSSDAEVIGGTAIDAYYRVHTEDGKSYIFGPVKRPNGGDVSADAFPAEYRRGWCNYSLSKINKTTVHSNNAVIDIDCKLRNDAPIRFSSIGQPLWYMLAPNSVANATYTPSYAYANGTAPTVSPSYPTPFTDPYSWAFIGNPYEFKLINKQQGTDQYLNIGNNFSQVNTTSLGNTGHGTWGLYKDSLSTGVIGAFSCKLIQTADASSDTIYKNLSAEQKYGSLSLSTPGGDIYLAAFKSSAGIGPIGAGKYSGKVNGAGTVNVVNGTGHTILTARPVRNVHYAVYNDKNEIVARSSDILLAAGTKPYLPDELRRGFCRYSYNGLNAVGNTTTEIRVDYEVDWKNFPFNISENTNDLQYYLLTAGATSTDGEGNYPQVGGDGSHQGSITTRNTTQLTSSGSSDANFFAFTGDPYHLQVYNKAEGKDRPLSLTSSEFDNAQASAGSTAIATLSFQAGEYASWEIFKDSYNNNESRGGYALRLSGAPLSADQPSLRATTSLWATATAGRLTLSKANPEVTIDPTYAASTTIIADNKPVSLLQTWMYRKAEFVVTREDGATIDTYPDENIVVGASPYLPKKYRKNFGLYAYFSDSSMQSDLPAVTDDITKIYVKESLSTQLPFKVSNPQTGEWHWYYIVTSENKLLSAAGPGPYMQFDRDNDYGSPLMLWAFDGSLKTGFHIHSRLYAKDFALTNPYDTHTHSMYEGPLMRITDKPTLWKLINYNGVAFGWQDAAHPDMNINLYAGSPFVTFDKDNAEQSSRSRFTFEEFANETVTDGVRNITLSPTHNTISDVAKTSYIQPMLDHAGSVFSLTKEAAERYKTLTTDEERLKLLCVPENYVLIDNNTVYTIQNLSTGEYLQCAPSDYISTMTSTYLTVEPDTRASSRWKVRLRAIDGVPGFEMQSQGLHMHADSLGAVMKNELDPLAMGVYPTYHGRSVLTTTINYHFQPARKAIASTDTRAVATTATVLDANAQWYITPSTEYKINTTPVSGLTDYYYHKVFGIASCLFDFPMHFEDEHTIPLYAKSYTSAQGTAVVQLVPFADRKVPSGTPFILITTTPDANTTAKILTDEPAFTDNDLLGGTFLKNTFGTGLTEYPYDDTRILAYRKSADRYVAIDAEGHKSGIVFVKAPTTYKDASQNKGLGPNVAFLNLKSVTAGAKATTFTISLDALDMLTTGIRDLDQERTSSPDTPWYDLSGRQVSRPTHGIYIRNGKKIVIK